MKNFVSKQISYFTSIDIIMCRVHDEPKRCKFGDAKQPDLLVVFVVFLFFDRRLVDERTTLKLLNNVGGGGGGVKLHSCVVTRQMWNLNPNNTLLVVTLHERE